MIYYTIYLKSLSNGCGYIDVALADDQLFKDYLQYLDVGIKPIRTYTVAMPPRAQGKPVANSGLFSINLSEITAITTVKPAATEPADPVRGAQPGAQHRSASP
jgi:hypothetical protein